MTNPALPCRRLNRFTKKNPCGLDINSQVSAPASIAALLKSQRLQPSKATSSQLRCRLLSRCCSRNYAYNVVSNSGVCIARRELARLHKYAPVRYDFRPDRSELNATEPSKSTDDNTVYLFSIPGCFLSRYIASFCEPVVLSGKKAENNTSFTTAPFR